MEVEQEKNAVGSDNIQFFNPTSREYTQTSIQYTCFTRPVDDITEGN